MRTHLLLVSLPFIFAACGSSSSGDSPNAVIETGYLSCKSSPDCPGSAVQCVDDVGANSCVELPAACASVTCACLAEAVCGELECQEEAGAVTCAAPSSDGGDTLTDTVEIDEEVSEVVCPAVADKCPAGCGELRGSPWNVTEGCREENVVIACLELGSMMTADAPCIRRRSDEGLFEASTGTIVTEHPSDWELCDDATAGQFDGWRECDPIGAPKAPLGNCDLESDKEGISSNDWCTRELQTSAVCQDGECIDAQPGGLPSEPPSTPPNPGDPAR